MSTTTTTTTTTTTSDRGDRYGPMEWAQKCFEGKIPNKYSEMLPVIHSQAAEDCDVALQ